MATIVERTSDKAVFILIGTGYAAYKAMRPGMFLGHIAPHEDSDQIAVIAVCDFEGRIGWIPSNELRVIEVDGAAPEQVLLAAKDPDQ